jgi:hypothetical protein
MGFHVYPDPHTTPDVVKKNPSVTVAVGSNGATLPQPTINLTTTAGLNPAGGQVAIVMLRTVNSSSAVVTYTGVTATTLTGCSGGEGTLATGDAVFPVTLRPIAQVTVPPAPGAKKKMFIRAAMVGGTMRPSFLLKAGTGEVATVPALPPNPASGVVSIFRAGSQTGYVGSARIANPNEANNLSLIEITFDQDTVETWQFGIINRDTTADREFTWVVADNQAETAQPWIHVAPATLPYNALVNETLDQSVTVHNKGTGTLTLKGVIPALPAELTITPPLGPNGLPILPGESKPIVFRFAAPGTPPAPDGTIPAIARTMDIDPADPRASVSVGHNNQLSLTATTQALEVVLLLDSSGSMAWDARGGDPPNAARSRWGELEDAAKVFLRLLAAFGQNHGTIGLAHFPAAPADPEPFVLVRPTTIPDDAGLKPLQDAIAAVNPNGSTPMGDGLNAVLDTPTPYFKTDALSVAANRRWLLLMSDGAHNSGTHNPTEFIPTISANRVRVSCVAYGIPGFTDVNHPLLQSLADASFGGPGQLFPVQVLGTTASDLAAALRRPIKAGLTSAQGANDPSAVFRMDQGEARHEAVITPHDTRAAFVLNWNTPDTQRLRLLLVTPQCEVITPENAGQGDFADVSFDGGRRHQMYTVGPDCLLNPSGTPRHGIWHLVVTTPVIIGPNLVEAEAADVDVEHYEFDVIVESGVRMDLALDKTTYFAGDCIGVSARLTAGGKPVTGANVVVSTTAPAQSAANWLARLKVPADALQQAKDRLSGQDASPLLVKSLGAQIAGLDFEQPTQQVSFPMTDPGGEALYQTTLPDTSVPEYYTFYVTATGVTDEGVSFRREGNLVAFVQVRPEPAFTALDIRQQAPGLADVTILTQDKFGNVLFVDPATTVGFGLVATGAQLAGPLTSNLDGTYTQTIQFPAGTIPSVGVQFGGNDLIKPQAVPPVGELHFVDRLVGFEPGPVKDANQHLDPSAALGSVAGKPADRFVSLGAGGVLTVAFHDQVIRATGEADVTVFVQPDADLRSYRVEALDEQKRWVSLGVSIGVTRSFGLNAANLDTAEAIRVIDTSLRAADSDGAPLATPGVSIRGIGVLEVARVSPSSGFATQGTFGEKGNFEAVRPVLAGGLAHFWRDNDAPDLRWHGPTGFASGDVFDAVALIQGNISTAGGGPGNLEIVVHGGDRLVHYWRDDVNPFPWHISRVIPGSDGTSGTPALIQGRFGARGNFEVVVPLDGGGLAHFWRDNDAPDLRWHGPTRFGSNDVYHAVALIQSNFSTAGGGPGNLEVIAQTGDRLHHYWRDDVNPFPWHGPIAIPGATGLG